MGALIADVALLRPLPPLSYRVPQILCGALQVGSLVQVPFRKSQAMGFVVAMHPDEPEGSSHKKFEYKEILSISEPNPLIRTQDFLFFKKIADYYQAELGEVLQCAYPKVLFEEKRKEKVPSISASETHSVNSISLTEEQQKAFDALESSVAKAKFQSFLLYGVTGSGKTEVYLKTAESCLKNNKSALILVPEIALTPQLEQRFEHYFQDQVAVLHSSLSDKKRKQFWWDLFHGRRKVAVGARSALFAPLKQLGLIIVDEEHEASYKQEDRVRYHARDMALVRGQIEQATVILGSATPSVETFHAAQQGKHHLLTLSSRPFERPLPTIEVVDLKNEQKSKVQPRWISGSLQIHLQEALQKKEQSLLFINRKGFASFFLCTQCGYVPHCPNCSVSLTFYQKARQMRCHYCLHCEPVIEQCPQCSQYELRYMGLGTERIEEELRFLFPSARIQRLDGESTQTLKQLNAKLKEFRNQEIDILIGTQMLAKGHDFPNVTLVGIISADMSLSIPDFRSCERTFQLLTQVAGRAGRADKKGKVILQTFLPNHYVIEAAKAQDYLQFYATEIENRRDFSYPPFSKLAQLEFREKTERKAMDEARKVERFLKECLQQGFVFEYLGPTPAAISKISNQYRWHILLKSEKISVLNQIVKTLKKNKLRWIDVDPIHTL